MFFTTLTYIYNSRCAWQLSRLSCVAALSLFVSCSSDSVIQEIQEIPEEKGDAINFTCLQQDISQTVPTRAVSLASHFMVSAYKSHAAATQQTVMDKYKVEYYTSGTAWNGDVRAYWDYIGVNGQKEKFWDYSSSPYRFHAIAPCPTDASDFTLTGNEVKIPKAYSMQTCIDGTISPANAVAEPYLLAQVHRDSQGRDKDMMSGISINEGSQTLNRYVALPFHHLNSKIRFAIYTTSPWATAHPMYIENLSIKATSAAFVTKAGNYSASGTDSWYKGSGTSGFGDLTRASGTEILHYTGVNADSSPIPGNDLSQWQSKSSAFWLQGEAGLMQIPQEGVEMKVSLTLKMISDKSTKITFTDVPVKLVLDDSSIQTKYNWQSGYIYTYYLILDNVGEKLEITFTATLAPWEDISGSLSTDLEQ